MITIGVTGGIGSGKSTVMNWLEKAGFKVYYSDEEAKKILNKKETITLLKDQFGEDITTKEGKIDRSKLASIVFQDKKQLEKLNQIIHPKVALDFELFKEKNSKEKAIFYESALIIETNNQEKFDYILLVTAPEQIKINRVKKRDNCSDEDVKKRMSKQLSDEEKRPFADFIIENIDRKETEKQIVKVLEFLNLY